MICVCSLAEMSMHARALRPTHLVSLVAPHELPETPAGIAPERHLRISVDDISEPMAGAVLPEIEHVSTLIEFLQTWDGQAPLLIHCVAGISRSMAAALTALVLRAEGREAEGARLLRQEAPHAMPNHRIVALADQLLGRQGRLIAARDAMGPARLMVTGPLVTLPPLNDMPVEDVPAGP